MTTDPRTAPLIEWNRLARENTENAIVSSMLEAMMVVSEPIEIFSTWLLVGTAAVAAFLITNADKVLPIIGHKGFLVCGTFLALSGFLGLVSRLYALRCKIQIAAGSAVRQTFEKHLLKHEEQEAKIADSAKVWGITLETGIRMERVLTEFFAPLPRVVVWFVGRSLKKTSGNPQMGYLPVIKGIQWQGATAGLQALLFLGFVIAGFIYAAEI